MWARIDDDEDREDEFRSLIGDLAAELPDDDPIAAFERGCAWDSTGHPDRADPLRNTGQAETAVDLLDAERSSDPATMDEQTRILDDAISAVLTL